MPIGSIVNTPNDVSSFGLVRSEHGAEYPVHESDLAADAEEGDDYAYHVELWQNDHGNITTLRHGVYGPEDF